MEYKFTSADFEKASFRIRDESTNQILTVGDRDFLYGAIVTEMSPNAEPEALKAQAVAAYTYYSRQRAQAHEKGADSDFSADPQNWKVYVSKEQMQERWGDSYQAYYEKLTEVINSIAGQTLQSNGELIDATYFAISSGKTESSEDVWGGKLDYLVPVASPGDLFASGYQTTASFSAEEFQNAVLRILEAVMFENWIRFYFLTEKLDAPVEEGAEKPLFVAIPEQGMQRIRELYPELLPLAESLNGKEISFALSQQAVCSFVMEHLDGKVMPQRMAETVFDSTTFQTRMQLFNAWVQMHENQLDQSFMEFGSWRELFAQWCSTDQVKELATRMAAPRAEGNGTTH